LTVYDASTTTNFKSYVLPDASTMDCFVLNPPPEALPNSSLAYYLGLMSRQFGDAASGYFVNDTGLRYDALVDALRDARERRRPVALLGTTFAFVHLLDRMADDGSRLHLSEGSRVFDTGGVKGRSRDIERNELATALVVRLGVPMDFQVNMYGLTELSTQFIDSSLRDHVRGRPGSRYKSIPPWSRTRVLDPETLEPIARGMPGVLCHTDLANRASVCTILTEDLGLETGDGFEIVGRVKGSQARGCSIAMDELLIATGRRA